LIVTEHFKSQNLREIPQKAKINTYGDSLFPLTPF